MNSFSIPMCLFASLETFVNSPFPKIIISGVMVVIDGLKGTKFDGGLTDIEKFITD